MASTLPLNIDKNLQPGMSGPDVKSLQQWLMDQGLLKIDAPTGFFGDLTKQALAEWQRKSGMQVPAGQEGFFGPLTRSAIQANQATPIEPDTKQRLLIMRLFGMTLKPNGVLLMTSSNLSQTVNLVSIRPWEIIFRNNMRPARP